ncbi:MAG: FAD-binding protein [Actinobacteria bacterium]|nr:FAD-binding protein [Actinomycetota bacterium]
MTPPTRLTGWGRATASGASVLPVSRGNIADAVVGAPERGALVRGLGRSYGDAAQNAGGLILRLAGLAGDAVLDTVQHTVTVGAGVSIDDLLRVTVPQGYFVPVTPGTRFVTIGGAIASDIHGKNHHGEGSFGNHVRRISLLLADGTTLEISPSQHTELFWATIGGMGLTGAIVDATISMLPIETSRCIVDTTRAHDLEHILTLMEEGDDRYRYSVAWIDLMAKGRHLGRSVLTRGDHATVEQLTGSATSSPRHYDPRVVASVPPVVPVSLINNLSVRAFNEFWFRKAPLYRTDEIHSLAGFFHPLDMVGSWNRIYGPRGFVQYQFLVPFGQEDALRHIVERFAASGAASFLAVLKRFGAGNAAPLSFPAPGWTLALDIPASFSGLGEILHELDHTVLDAGGRHYLAKDSHTTPQAISRGYPRLAEWQDVRNRSDPTGVWRSDLGRRLGLIA